MTHQAVVTGGAGFIGSHLVERLLADGHRVRVVDNLATGSMENLAGCLGNPGLEVVRMDVADFSALRPRLEGVDWVFHLAGLADLVPSIQKPLDYHAANVAGTASLVEAARLAGVKRVVYAASSSCYGLPEIVPTPETARVTPLNPYAFTKRLAEEYLLHWHKVYGLPVVSLRLFNVYGPRSRTTGAYGAVFGVFLAQKLAGKPFTVVGDGTQTRDFIFVTDVADAFVKAAESDASGEIFNVGSGTAQSVNTLVELIGGEVVRLPRRPGETDRSLADITKIRSRLGWEPRVPFAQGVRILMDNIAMWKDAPVWDVGKVAEATQDWFRYLGPGDPAH